MINYEEEQNHLIGDYHGIIDYATYDFITVSDTHSEIANMVICGIAGFVIFVLYIPIVINNHELIKRQKINWIIRLFLFNFIAAFFYFHKYGQGIDESIRRVNKRMINRPEELELYDLGHPNKKL